MSQPAANDHAAANAAASSIPTRLNWPAQIWQSPRFLMALVALGFLLCLRQFLFNRTLWLDESLLAMNILNRDFAALAQPLADNQSAPVGFLWLVKLATIALGPTEGALRLVPLLAALTGLGFFAWTARRWLSPSAAPFAVAFAAGSGVVIYYASELKQYTADFAAAAILYALVVRLEREPGKFRPFVSLAIAGAVLIWFSNGALFLLAGIGLTLAAQAWRQREQKMIYPLAVVACVWVNSFIALYFLSLRQLGAHAALHQYWTGFGDFGARQGFAPFPPATAAELLWYPQSLYSLFAGEEGPVASRVAPVMLAICLLGVWRGFKANPLRKWLLITPVLMTLALSMLGQYPFHGRLLLFALPAILLLTAEGLIALEQTLPRGGKAGWVVVMLVLLAPTVGSSALKFAKPRAREDMRVPLEYLKANLRAGDVLFMDHQRRRQYEFYRERYELDRGKVVIGTALRMEALDYVRELETLRGHPRVWALYSYSPGDASLVRDYLSQHGKVLEEHDGNGTRVTLFDLSGR